MTYNVRIRPDAERDIEEAAQWYELQRQGLGHEFMDSVQQTLNRISENPSLYPVVHRNSRRALISKFPFGVHYVVTGDTVVVIAVMHGRRHPNWWKERS
ncbi:type II toxin-antitoxin system RelE/ParE family toxin [Halomonadaceae bacterium KBTZ08]